MSVANGRTITLRRARLIREARNMSLQEVCRATGLDPGQLSRFERNVFDLRYKALRALSHYYRVPIDELRKLEEVDEAVEASA